MSETTKLSIRIVVHGSGSGMTIRENGRIIGTLASEPGRLWQSAKNNDDRGTVSMSYCQRQCLVLRADVKI
jgi:hypothetical protein